MSRTPPSAAPPPTPAVVRALPVAFENDAALAVAAAEGHPAAARAIWQRYSVLVRSLLVRSIGPDADVEDLVQETFLRFFNRAAHLRDPSALTSFIVGITMRVARSELRKRRVRRWLSFAGDELPEVPTEGDDLEGREALRRVYAILNKLDDETRLAFVLRHIQGLELGEVATALDCSLATAKRRLAKAAERLGIHARRDPHLVRYVEAMQGEVSHA